MTDRTETPQPTGCDLLHSEDQTHSEGYSNSDTSLLLGSESARGSLDDPSLGVQKSAFAPKASRYLGIAQMSIGLTWMLVNGLVLGLYKGPFDLRNVGFGILGGTLFFVAGLLSVYFGKENPKRCLMISTVMICVVAACFTAFLLFFGIASAVESKRNKRSSGLDDESGVVIETKVIGVYRSTGIGIESVDVFYEAIIVLASIIMILHVMDAMASAACSSSRCGKAFLCCFTSTPALKKVSYSAIESQNYVFYYKNQGFAPSADQDHTTMQFCAPSIEKSDKITQ